MHTLALILLSTVPRAPVPERIDLLETNHQFDGEGRELFSQLVAWDWNERKSRFECRGYQIIKAECQLPRPDCCGRRTYTAVWYFDGVARVVIADSYRETWTQGFDPEVLDREVVPVELRRELRKK